MKKIPGCWQEGIGGEWENSFEFFQFPCSLGWSEPEGL